MWYTSIQMLFISLMSAPLAKTWKSTCVNGITVPQTAFIKTSLNMPYTLSPTSASPRKSHKVSGRSKFLSNHHPTEIAGNWKTHKKANLSPAKGEEPHTRANQSKIPAIFFLLHWPETHMSAFHGLVSTCQKIKALVCKNTKSAKYYSTIKTKISGHASLLAVMKFRAGCT